jgi:hypothetical protein
MLCGRDQMLLAALWLVRLACLQPIGALASAVLQRPDGLGGNCCGGLGRNAVMHMSGP